MTHAAELISILQSSMQPTQERMAKKVAKGRIDQAKADEIIAEIQSEVDAAIAAIKEVERVRGEEVASYIPKLDAEARDCASIVSLAERLLARQ